MSVPLTLQGNILGVINLISLDKKRGFRERELRLLEILASQCAQFVENARLHESLFVETERLRKEVRGKYAPHGIIGHSPKMLEVFALLERVIPTDGRVLIRGESGAGKELIARMIHYGGPRKEKSFVAVDCGALPANILESELFGYTRGAFTGANRDKKGLFEEADGGTLFLDEIANMPTEIQSKFLRAIQEGEIRPLGSNRIKKVDVRIISASSSNLAELVKAKTFRQDLFYRLNVIEVTLPPLRERREDIVVLADHFLRKHNRTHGKKLRGFKPETITHFENYAWPGNVRELENAVERMVILAEFNLKSIHPDLLPQEIRSAGMESPADSKSSGTSNIHHQKDSYEREMILSALKEHQWNQSAAARTLGIAESSLRYKLQKYQIRKH